MTVKLLQLINKISYFLSLTSNMCRVLSQVKKVFLSYFFVSGLPIQKSVILLMNWGLKLWYFRTKLWHFSKILWHFLDIRDTTVMQHITAKTANKFTEISHRFLIFLLMSKFFYKKFLTLISIHYYNILT